MLNRYPVQATVLIKSQFRQAIDFHIPFLRQKTLKIRREYPNVGKAMTKF